MISSSKSVGAVGPESAKHSKHPVALRLFYYTVIAIVGAALLPVIPAAAAKAPAPQVSSAPSAYTAVNPTRVMDTRTGSGIVGAGNTLGPAASFSLVVAPNATAGVPANATAVVMNVTATDTTAASYLTVYPTLDSLPFASNLNWVAGYTVPNLVTVQPGSGGAVTFYNKFGSVDVIADIAGYFAPPSGSAGGEVGTGFPQRLVDTRAGSGHLGAGSAIGPAATATYQVTGNAGVPATGVSAVILNSTVTNTTAASFLTLWAGAPAARNTVSNDNWVAGWTRANRVIVPVSATGSISVYNQFGSVDVILDVNGYFTDSTASGKLFTSVSPIRLADHTALGPNSSFNLSIGGVAGVPVGASAAILDAVVSETTAPSFLTASPSPGVSSTSDVNWVAGQVNPNLTVTTLGTGGQVNFYNSAGNVNVSVDLEGYFGGAVAGVIVSASPSSVPADNVSAAGRSTVTATVTNAAGTAAINDPVNFTTSGGTSCGTFTTTNPTPTNGSGVATVTYQASTTTGTCTITATEAQGGLSGSTTITQTRVANTISTTATPNTLLAGGAPTSSIVSTVTNSVTGAVVGDVVSYTLGANPAGACGTLSASSATTGAGGVTPAVTYTASTTVGFCTVTATEAGTSSSTTAAITQHGTATNTTAVTANPTGPFPADGVKTSTITATVTGNGIANDLVSFTMSGAAAVCGTLSAASATTSATGVASVTYTVSTTAGTCTITATEANGGSSNTVAIVQNPVPNNIALTATPSTLPADGATTSSLKAVVTKGVGGAVVSGDTVTFVLTGAPCGGLSSATAVTDASGTATVTYTASTTTGFCTVTATDGSAGSGGPITITQNTTAASTVAVVANPSSVPADNVSAAGRSVVTATVSGSGGGPVPLDSVNFTTSGGTSCGTFTTTNPTPTNGAGKASVTYQASATTGTCTITATEASLGKTGTATITQTKVLNTISTTATPNTLLAGGAPTSSVVSTVTNSVTGAVVGDIVSYTLGGNPAGACGTLSASSATTGAGGVTPAVTYTASTTVGFCTVTATEAGTSSSTTAAITQHGTATNTTAVTASPTGPFSANGTTTSTVTATVTGNGIATDLVSFTKSGAAGVCGTLSAASATTNSSGVASVVYTVSTTAGTCTITATESNSGSFNSVAIVQNPVPNNIALAANPSTIKGDGISTSVVTATVTKGVGGAAVAGDTVNFTVVGANCGTLSAASAVTDAGGHATVTYTSKLAPSTFCDVHAVDVSTGSPFADVNITQTA
jgi:hypothetical protein